eukprot:gene9570-9771_t
MCRAVLLRGAAGAAVAADVLPAAATGAPSFVYLHGGRGQQLVRGIGRAGRCVAAIAAGRLGDVVRPSAAPPTRALVRVGVSRAAMPRVAAAAFVAAAIGQTARLPSVRRVWRMPTRVHGSA